MTPIKTEFLASSVFCYLATRHFLAPCYNMRMSILLETKRLYLREMGEGDFEALKKVISDPKNMIYYPKPYDDDGVHRWISWCMKSYQEHGFGLWAVILKETDEMIGDCGVSMQPINGNWVPEIGYHIRKDMHRRGYAKEAAEAVKKYFFSHFAFDEVFSYMEADNMPSYKTAEALGMTLRFTYEAKDGQRLRVYSITRKEWEERK